MGVFVVIVSRQNSIVLSGDVYLDEKYFIMAHSEVGLRPDGKRQHELLRNQWYVAMALGPETNVMDVVDGKG